MPTKQDIISKTELFFRETLKLGEINKRNGVINCGRCFLRLDEYIRDGRAPDEVSPVGIQDALLFTHPDYKLQEGVLRILRSYTKDTRLLQRCAPLANRSCRLFLGKRGENKIVEAIDLTVEPQSVAIDKLYLQSVDTSQGQARLIETLKNLPRRAKDGTAYGCILLTWPSTEAHILNFFVTSKEDDSEVFFIDAQVNTISQSLSTEALPDIYFLQSTPPEGFEIDIQIKKEPDDNETLPLPGPIADYQTVPLMAPQNNMAAIKPDELVNLYTTCCPDLSIVQFYKIFVKNGGTRSYTWVREQIGKVASKVPRASSDEINAVINLYKERYADLSIAQFYEIWSSPEHGGKRSYSWVKKQLNTVAPKTNIEVLPKVDAKAEALIRLYKEQYSHLNISQFYQIWHSKGESGSYTWVREQLSNIAYKGFIRSSEDEINTLVNLYKTQYANLSLKKFHKIWSEQHGGKRSYCWVSRILKKESLSSEDVQQPTKKMRISNEG